MIAKNNSQLTHTEHKSSGKKFPLDIIAADITRPENVGSLFRLCDALGIEKLYLCGSTTAPPNKKINMTSRSTEKYVDYEIQEDTLSLIKKLKSADNYIIALEISSASIAINSSEFINIINANKNKKFSLILGSEKDGLSDAILASCDSTIHIPMFGNNSSMNVISAASIACFEIIKNLL